MALSLEENIALRQHLRRDVTDYGPPGIRMHPPVAARDLRLPSGVLRPPSPAKGALGPAIPPFSVRLWPFYLTGASASPDRVHVIRSPAFRGPVVLHTFTFASRAAAAASAYLNLAWSPTAEEERSSDGVNRGVVGTLIHEYKRMVYHGGAVSSDRFISRHSWTDTAAPYIDHHLNYYIAHVGTVYLYIQLYYSNDIQYDGWIRLIEEVDPADWCPF